MTDPNQLLTTPKDSACYASMIVQELVNNKNFSLSRIAKRCCVSTSTIQKLYLGSTTNPRAVTFNRLLIIYHRAMYGLRAEETHLSE